MTPNDIYNTKFDKAVGGYKVEDVNKFVIAVGDYVQSLLTERDDLEDKLEILAEKLEEYRNDEESLRAAIVGAQKLGDSVVRDSRQKADSMMAEAKVKSDEMMAEARYKAEVMLDDTRRSIETEEYALESVKASVVKFKRKIMSMYEQQIRLIKEIPFDERGVEINPQRPSYLSRDQEPVAEPEPKEQETEPEEPMREEEQNNTETLAEGQGKRRQSHFGPLLFGEDFNLTRKD